MFDEHRSDFCLKERQILSGKILCLRSVFSAAKNKGTKDQETDRFNDATSDVVDETGRDADILVNVDYSSIEGGCRGQIEILRHDFLQNAHNYREHAVGWSCWQRAIEVVVESVVLLQWAISPLFICHVYCHNVKNRHY